MAVQKIRAWRCATLICREHARNARLASDAGGNFSRCVVAFKKVLNGEGVMILGMSLATFTMVHVIISLIAIVAGLIVMFAMLGANKLPGLTAIFLLFTILTSATGFLFPFEQLLPSHMI